MKFLSEKDIKRNFVSCIMLLLCLFLVPFASNVGVKCILSLGLVLLTINFVLIIWKLFSNWIKSRHTLM